MQKILIVDDEPYNLITLEGLLESFFENCSVLTATNGVEAIASAKNEYPDLIMLDISMPVMDGFEACRRLKSDEKTAHIPLMMFTGIGDIDNKVKSLDLGADAFLSKPINPMDLRAQVNVLLRTKKAEDQLRGEKKALQLKVQEQTEELLKARISLINEEKLAFIGRLSAGIAHELNNPVSYIKSNVSFLKKILNRLVSSDRKDGDQADIVGQLPEIYEDLDDGFERVMTIIDSLKLFSRKNETIEWKKTSINEQIRLTVKLVTGQLKNVAEIDLELDDIPMVYCHSGEINQVLLNLVINSIQSIESSGNKNGLITIGTKDVGLFVEISIRDNGLGIPKEKQKEIFEPFYTTKPVGLGTGLGLSLAYDIICQKHNGKILCESDLNKGAEFKLILPIKK